MIRRLVALAALAGVLVGGVLRLLRDSGAADAVWAASTALMLVPLTWSVARTLWRRDVGVDTIALVAMLGAGARRVARRRGRRPDVLRRRRAGGVASRRARRELTRLVERAPRVARLRVDELARGGPRRRGRARRRGARAHRRGDPRRRHRGQRRGGRRHEHAQRRAAARHAARRDAGDERHRQRGRAVRRARRRAPRPRAPTPRSCGSSSRRTPSARRWCGMADRYAGIFLPAHARRRRARVGAQRRPGARPGRRWSSPRRARSSSPRRSRWCPGSRAPRAAA